MWVARYDHYLAVCWQQDAGVLSLFSACSNQVVLSSKPQMITRRFACMAIRCKHQHLAPIPDMLLYVVIYAACVSANR